MDSVGPLPFPLQRQIVRKTQQISIFPDKAALLEGIAEQVWRLTFESFLDRVDAGAVDSASTPTREASEPTEGAPSSPLLAYMRAAFDQ